MIGKRHWLHVASTSFLTHLAWHPKCGKAALEVIGIWPRFHGRGMHDRWTSYDHYACAHSICGAHLLRDCLYVQEQEQQEWAGQMHDLLLSMAAAAQEWRHRGVKAVPSGERDEWIAQYFELLAQGFAAQPAFSPEEVPKQRGRRKQSAAKNLLDELLRRAEQVLAFLDNLSIPFTNNQAERDLRMVSRATKDLRPLSRVATGPQRFVAFAVISRRCANRNMPCWLPWRRSLSASPSRSPGAPKLLQNYLREDDTAMSKPRMLTGDRPTGKLHLGHYVGTLKKRVKLQQEYESFFIIADLHMLTTKHLPEHIRETDVHARELVLDAISAGIEPEHATFYLQSGVHEISEMYTLFQSLVTVSRLERIPSLKEMARDANVEMPFGLLGYPVLQAADILCVKANVVPVGKDNVAHVEVTREIARRFNSLYGEIFPIPEVIVGEVPTLVC